MNFTTIIFGAFVFFFVWRGYQKGFIGSITRIVSWLIAYPSAIYLTNPVAKLIFQHSNFDGMIVYFIAGSAIFLIVSFSVSKLLTMFSESIPENTTTENSSKIGGAIVGSLVGGIVGLLVVYAIDITQKPATANPQNNNEESLYVSTNHQSASNQNSYDSIMKNNPPLNERSIPIPAADSFIDASAKKLVSTIAATAIDVTVNDATTTSLTKAFAENPQSMLGHIQQLSNDGEIKNLLSNPDIQKLLTKGDTNELLANEDFQSLINNADMQAILANVDDEKSGKTSQQLTAEKMVTAWARTNAIKNDPRVIAIITDPEFQQQMNASNKLPLLTNPKLKMLTEIIFQNPTQTATESTQYTTQDITNDDEISQQPATDSVDKIEETEEGTENGVDKTKKKIDQKIYRWTDKNGEIHFSDTPIIE